MSTKKISAVEQKLTEYIDKLKEELEAAEGRANDAEHELNLMKEHQEDGRDSWAQPRKWEVDDLPVPRLEMRWSRDDEEGYNCRCTYVLVYRHLLDGVPKPMIVANPMGETRSNGRQSRFMFNERIDMPFRESAHARSDAFQLKLPLYVTTEDGDADLIVFAAGGTYNQYTQVTVRRSVKDGQS